MGGALKVERQKGGRLEFLPSSVCAWETYADVRFCPLSPTIGTAIEVDSTVGERDGVAW